MTKTATKRQAEAATQIAIAIGMPSAAAGPDPLILDVGVSGGMDATGSGVESGEDATGGVRVRDGYAGVYGVDTGGGRLTSSGCRLLVRDHADAHATQRSTLADPKKCQVPEWISGYGVGPRC